MTVFKNCLLMFLQQSRLQFIFHLFDILKINNVNAKTQTFTDLLSKQPIWEDEPVKIRDELKKGMNKKMSLPDL